MKYGKEILTKTEEFITANGLIEYGGAKLQDFLSVIGINDRTYRHWLEDKPEFKRIIEDSKSVFKKNLSRDLVISLATVAKGYEKEETETEYRPNPQNPQQPTIVKMKRKKVYYQPNVGAAIFLLTNLDPEHFVNRQKTDIAFKNDDNKEMSLEEINKELERLSKLDKDEE